jgi:hypothetical protein
MYSCCSVNIQIFYSSKCHRCGIGGGFGFALSACISYN